MIGLATLSSAAAAVAVCAAGIAAYGRDGLLGALLWGLACVGTGHLVRSGSVARRRPAADGITPETADEVREIDAVLRGLAHDLRSPIAAATAAFVAFDERVGEIADDDDAAYFRGAVRQNLDEARERLRTLEQHRLRTMDAASGPGVRAARRAVRSPGRR